MVNPLRVLVAGEYSGRVRDAFKKRGHSAMSADLLPTEMPGEHYQGDVRDVMNSGEWDLMVGFPPCTHLSSSGARHWCNKQKEQAEALRFVQELMDADIPHIAIENPVGKISTAIRKPDQYVQPRQFGDGYSKKTGLWLKDLPKLEPTEIVTDIDPNFIHHMAPGPDRGKLRSLMPQGMADAMADQWGRALKLGGAGAAVGTAVSQGQALPLEQDPMTLLLNTQPPPPQQEAIPAAYPRAAALVDTLRNSPVHELAPGLLDYAHKLTWGQKPTNEERFWAGAEAFPAAGKAGALTRKLRGL